MAVVLAVVLGTALPSFEAAAQDQNPGRLDVLAFSGGPDAARAVLQSISGSLITVTSLTFSLTVVTLQLASSQFSPRVLRTFASDRFVHWTLALFLAAFAFALTVLLNVRDESSSHASFVPEVSVTAAFGLAIASVIGLVLFLAHLTREIRVETVMRRVNAETQETIDRVFPVERPDQGHEPANVSPAVLIKSTDSGFLTSVDHDSLLEAALEAGAVIRIDRQPGGSLIEGVPFATAWSVTPGATFAPAIREKLSEEVNAAVTAGFERTKVQDVGFGFRQLVDVAARALSPGVNDPTTAVHVIGHLSVLLCRLAGRNPGTRNLTDDNRRVRVVLALPTLPDLLELAMNQPRQYGTADPLVAERLLELLQELTWCDLNGRYRTQILDHVGRMRAAISAEDHPPEIRQRLMDLASTISATT